MIKKIKIQGNDIEVNFKSYTTSKSVKIYVKENMIHLSYPKRISQKYLMEIIKKNETVIFEKYLFIKNNIKPDYGLNNNKIMILSNMYNVLYILEKNCIDCIDSKLSYINFKIDEKKCVLKIYILEEIYNIYSNDIIYNFVSKNFKIFLKNLLYNIIKDRIEHISNDMGIVYNKFKITNSKTRLGFCKPKTLELGFSLYLAMTNFDVIDSIIVHELAHIIYPNHSKDFYNLVNKYCINYDKNIKWINENKCYFNF